MKMVKKLLSFNLLALGLNLKPKNLLIKTNLCGKQI